MTLTAIAWAVYISLCIWPPVSVLIPRIETESGWKISWDTAIDDDKLMVDDKKRVIRRPRKQQKSKAGTAGDASLALRDNMVSRKKSLIGLAVKQMEEAQSYDFAGLTKDTHTTFRPGLLPDQGIRRFDR
jgi:hypothetical protein